MAVEEEGVVIEEAATRPPMMPFCGLPLKLGLLLFAIGAILVVLISSWKGEAIVVGTDLIIIAALRPLVARDLNGFDIWLAWLRLDVACFDTKAWGGASVSPNPIRETEFFGMSDHA